MWNYKVAKAQWLLSGDATYMLEMTGQITGAEFFNGVDERLANQKASIDRLMAHLKHHCPDLGPPSLTDLFTVCGYQE
jgi:hypothetical protein